MQREGTLYDQGLTSAVELSQHVEKGGLALFGGCTTVEVHRPDSALALRLPVADLAAGVGEPLSR